MHRRDFLVRTSTLLGCSLSQATIAAVLNQNESKAPSGFSLSANERATAICAAEAILPRTDTPGATDANVISFIELIVGDWYTPNERNRFLAGLNALNNKSVHLFNQAFATASITQHNEVLSSLDAAASQNDSIGGTHSSELQSFYTQLKELTIVGYFTSEVGSKQALNYNPMPMKYDGEYPHTEASRQWSY